MADEINTPEACRRKAALACMDQFADANGVTNRNWREVPGKGRVDFIGVAPDGREFGIGYEVSA